MENPYFDLRVKRTKEAIGKQAETIFCEDPSKTKLKGTAGGNSKGKISEHELAILNDLDVQKAAMGRAIKSQQYEITLLMDAVARTQKVLAENQAMYAQAETIYQNHLKYYREH